MNIFQSLGGARDSSVTKVLCNIMRCPLCKSTETVLFHDKVWSLENGKVYQCKDCDLTFIYPIMTAEETAIFYKNFNKHLMARGVTLSVNTEETHLAGKRDAEERFNVVGRFFSSKKKVLDIGSSTGAFLELIGSVGAECYCVEPSDDNRKYCERFVERSYCDVGDIESSERFDVICSFHVLEHIKDPFSFLRMCSEHLNRKGFIIIEVPNIEDPLLSLYNCTAFKNFYFQPMHPYIYSLKTLRYVFGWAGLKEVEIIFHQRYGLDNHLAWLSKGTPRGDPSLEMLFSSVGEYRKKLEDAKRTDTIFYIAKLEEI